MKLHIDVETYSSIDIQKAGAYKYTESLDFEILICCFAFDDGPVQTIDLAQGEPLPQNFIDALMDPAVEKHAHNAAFERLAFKAIGYEVPIEQWHCSAVKAAYCGYPLALQGVSDAMKLGEKGKKTTGKALIRYFSIPCKPTKTNEGRMRNLPQHDPEKWEEYKIYCQWDVEAEREVSARLEEYEMPVFERLMYILDQQINDRGIKIDTSFAANAWAINELRSKEITSELQLITGLENPNSGAQLKGWLSEALQKEVTTLAKAEIPSLLEDAPPLVKKVLEMRSKISKTSIKKYVAMEKCVCDDDRAHGLFQFYGANRTGRWAGRLVQLQNLPQNHLADLDGARNMVAEGDYDLMVMSYDDIPDTLSQLIRTSFIAPEGMTFAVADFSAIEARVIAWLASEEWRLDVFKTHGKIYEASASMMFGIPVEQIDKGSPERQKGKVAELALGYQGAVGALKKMGGEAMGLSEQEMDSIVKKWRAANKMIVRFWKALENAALRAIETRKPVRLDKYKGIIFDHDGKVMTIQLPSGRKLFYQSATITANKWGSRSIKYKGLDQVTKKWWWIESYGGKFAENIVQAVARDLLAFAMMNMDAAGFPIVMHVHDEAVCEIDDNTEAPEMLKRMCDIMAINPSWAVDIPLKADGYLTPYYKKD